MAVGMGASHGDVFDIISAHIVGMFGLVFLVGVVVVRIGNSRAMAFGLALMAVSNAALVWFTSVAGMALCLFGLGLGWNLSYVGATTELVGRAAPGERGRLVGATDFAASLTGAALALAGGVLLSNGGSSPLVLAAAGLAALPAAWIALLPSRLVGGLVRRFSV
jgi:MFS family permease